MAEHGNKTDETFIIQLAVTQVQVVNPPEISISENLPGDLMDASLCESVAGNFDGFDRPQLEWKNISINYCVFTDRDRIVQNYEVTFLLLIEINVCFLHRQ